MKLSAEQRILVAVSFLLATLVVVCALSWFGAYGLIVSNRALISAYATSEDINQLLSRMKDAETGERGYALTGEDDFLQPYKVALPEIAAILARLEAKSARVPQLNTDLAALRPRIGDALAVMARIVEQRRRQGAAFASDPALDRQGKATMDAVRTTVAGMLHNVETRLRQRRARAETRGWLIIGAVTLLTLLMLALIPLLYVGIRRQLRARELMTTRLWEARNAALEAMQVRSQFLANMSHEIRTPLNGVIGMTEILLETPLSAEQRGYAETVRDSSVTLLNIVNDILDLSKMEAGKMRLETIDLDLQQVLESAVEGAAQQAAAKRLDLMLDITDDVPRLLRGDPLRLRQILANLLSNAIKFTEHGEVLVRVRCASDGFLRFEVRDSGIGIDEDTRRRLFQAFVQADSSTTRQYGGTGLGLVICRQLVESMGGEIGVDSQPGRGSCFWFTLRLEQQDGAPRPARDDPSLRGSRVLIVDDNVTNRRILERQVRSWGMSADEAESSAQALERLRVVGTGRDGFAALLLDLAMPDVDGVELTRRIRAEARFAGARVLMLTSFSDREQRERALAAGVDRVLVKPVRQSQLFDALVGLLDGEPAPAAPSTQSAPQSASPPAPSGGRHGRVLLVEDNAVNQRVARLMLERRGCTVSVAGDGRQALEAIAAARFDLVLMDCQMPVMDGFAATAEIRRRETSEGGGRRTPVVAMTANAMAGDRQRCLEAGMDDYLAKPVSARTLEAALTRWLPAAAGGEIDWAAFEAVGDGDAETLSGLATLYLEQMRDAVPRLRQSLQAKDWETFAGLAHSVAGSSSTCGIIGLASLLRELERSGREAGSGASPGPAAEGLDRLAAALEGVEKQLHDHLRVLQPADRGAPQA